MKIRATRIWPTPARIHSQMPRGPELFSANPYDAKMPDVIEMNENPTANEVKLERLRPSCC